MNHCELCGRSAALQGLRLFQRTGSFGFRLLQVCSDCAAAVEERRQEKA